jgi:hypothetical protein
MSQSDLLLLSAQKEHSLTEPLCSRLYGLVTPVEVRINGLPSGCFVLVYDSQIFLSSPPRRHSSKSEAQVPGTCSANEHLITFAHTPDLVKLQEASLPRNAYPAYESRLALGLTKLSQFSSVLVRLANISKILLSTTSVVLETVLVPRWPLTTCPFGIGVMSYITSTIGFQ